MKSDVTWGPCLVSLGKRKQQNTVKLSFLNVSLQEGFFFFMSELLQALLAVLGNVSLDVCFVICPLLLSTHTVFLWPGTHQV